MLPPIEVCTFLGGHYISTQWGALIHHASDLRKPVFWGTRAIYIQWRAIVHHVSDLGISIQRGVIVHHRSALGKPVFWGDSLVQELRAQEMSPPIYLHPKGFLFHHVCDLFWGTACIYTQWGSLSSSSLASV